MLLPPFLGLPGAIPARALSYERILATLQETNARNRFLRLQINYSKGIDKLTWGYYDGITKY
jgi:hypothetical protein